MTSSFPEKPHIACKAVYRFLNSRGDLPKDRVLLRMVPAISMARQQFQKRQKSYTDVRPSFTDFCLLQPESYVQQTASPSRVAPGPPAPPPAPPAPPISAPSSCPPPAPPLPPSGGAPPPPPPPPPNLLKADNSKGMSLADQLRGAQLKKTGGIKEGRSVSIAEASGGHGS
ncbi:hypothetical protein ANCDUO_25315, partial [Ancylostoma duodenale]